jgi:integrase
VPEGTFPTTRTFHADLQAAGIAREGEDGRVVDFHALRTTYISWLAAGGVHPRVAQQLARHASIETTMARYTDLSLLDLGGAVEALPLPEAPRGKRRRPISTPRVWDRRGGRKRAHG